MSFWLELVLEPALVFSLRAERMLSTSFRPLKSFLADHRGKNIILQPKVLWEFADRYLDALFDPDLLEKVSGKVSISITGSTV